MTIEPIGIAMPTSDPRLKSVVTNYISAFEGSGHLEELRRKWLEEGRIPRGSFSNGSWVVALP